MAEVFLGLGSNIGDSRQILKNAIEELKKIGTVVAVSSFYKTEPVGVKDQPWFVNCVVKIETELEPIALLQETQKIENMFGRERTLHWGPRTLDIDILFYDTLVVQTPELKIPHPCLHERRFVLEPLMEIEPKKMHPALQKTVQDLFQNLSDLSEVQRQKYE